MSAIARPIDSAAAADGVSALRARSTTLAAVGLAGLAAGAGAFALVATSDHLVDPLPYGLLIADVVLGSVAVAIVWLVRRPGNRIALLLLALAASAAGISLQGASNPYLHSVGVLFDPVFFVVSFWAVFAFPSGRLDGLLDRLLVAAPTALILVSFLPWFLFSPYVAGGNPLAGCTAECPPNALMVADRPGIAAGVGRAEQYFAVGVAVAVLATIVVRVARSTRPRRRALLPVYVPAALVTVPFGLYQAAGAGLITLDPDEVRRIGWFLNVGRGTLSYGFLLALVLAALFADDALKTIVRSARRTPHPAHLQSAIADALDDRSLRVAFRDGGRGEFVGVYGDPVAVADLPDGLSATPVVRAGETVAYIVHDAALDADPELVEAAGDAMLLALESGRLEQELRTTISDLRASRDRLAAARDSERRRIERDLHDGAQQHLFALGMKVDRAARELADENPELARELADVGAGLDEVVDDLRHLAQAIAPPALSDFGLGPALALVAQRAAPPARYDVDGIGRYAEGIETAVYFCCLEAVQNVARHAGAGVSATLRLWESSGALWFEVADDGIGFRVGDGAGRGQGLASMADRVEALGGSLTVESEPGRGTHVRGCVPAGGAA